MPVRIWTMRRVSEALPKMYHQPIGPADPRGMGCSIIGSRAARRLKRASNQLPISRSVRIMTSIPCSRPHLPSGTYPVSSRVRQGVLEGRVVRRLDFQLIDPPNVRHAVDTMKEAARGRAGGALAVGVVDAAVTRAHE